MAIPDAKDVGAAMIQRFRKLPLTPSQVAHRSQSPDNNDCYNDLVEYVSETGDAFFAEATVTVVNKGGSTYYLYVLHPVELSFFDAMTIGMVLVNQLHQIVTVNPFLLQQFGYEKHELIGKKIEVLIPARFHDNHIRQRNRFSQHLGSRPMGSGLELFAIKKDGREFPVEIGLGNYYSDAGKYFIAFISDISLQKQASAKLRSLNEELERLVNQRTSQLKKAMLELEDSKTELSKVNAFQKALLDYAGAIIISVDKSGIIQSVNLAGEQQLGYKADELIGKHTPLLLHDPALIHKRAAELSGKMGRPVSEDMELFFYSLRNGHELENEWIYVRKDGSKFPVQLHVSTMKNEAGDCIGFTGVAVDITKIKAIELELQAALKKERELGELKSRFVAMASHEFRTPLSTILSSSYLIEKYTAAEEQLKRTKHIQKIISSVGLLTSILDDFLSLGRLQEGKIPIKFVEFDIREMVGRNISDLEHTLKGAQKILYAHEGALEVSLDPVLLSHILVNLISNASKFSPDNGHIEIKTVREKDSLLLSVKDYGIGISPEDQQHLTERFFRGANAVNIQGTGLGLHIADRYCELMNGKLRYTSELGKGTAFTISFQIL